eukprot:8537509-Ditylum_brightwellii.AAC.1
MKLGKEWNKVQLNYVGFTRVLKGISDVCCGRELCLDEIPVVRKEEDVEKEHVDAPQPQDTTSTKAKKKVPLIVHNGLMDLLFLTTHFITPTLPTSYTELKSLLSTYFPLICDTKILSNECSDTAIQNGSTVL